MVNAFQLFYKTYFKRNYYTDEPIIVLSSNGSFFIIYTVAVVILVISLVVGWKLPDLIGGNSKGNN